MSEVIVTKTAMVLKCLTDKPGLVVYKDDIVDQTGLPEHTVRATIANIRQTGQNSPSGNHPGRFIEIVARGQAWMYRPNHVEQPAFQPPQHHRPRGTVLQAPLKPELPLPAVEPPKAVAKSSSDIFERVGKTDRHEIVVKDETGKLFKVVPL